MEDPEATAGSPTSTTTHQSSHLPAKAPRRQKPASDRLTARQAFYLFGMHGVGAMIISGGINFAVAYGMYAHNDDLRRPIRLWKFPNTVAGDVGVTIIIQTLITWIVEMIIVRVDLRKGAVPPIGFFPRPQRPILRRLFMLDEFKGAASPGRPRHWPAFAGGQALTISVFALASFIFLFGPAIGVLIALGNQLEGHGSDPYYARVWAPEIFKGVFGGLLGLLATPWMAAFWLARAGWTQGAVGGETTEEAEGPMENPRKSETSA